MSIGRGIIVIFTLCFQLPKTRPVPWVLNTLTTAVPSTLGPSRCLESTHPSPTLSSASSAGKCGPGRDHVLPLLPAHSRQAHPHRDQVPQSQGHGHHGLLRYLSYPTLPLDLPEVQTIEFRRVFRKKGRELPLFLGAKLLASKCPLCHLLPMQRCAFCTGILPLCGQRSAMTDLKEEKIVGLTGSKVI